MWVISALNIHPAAGLLQVVIFVKSVLRAKELNKLLIECNFPSICIHSAMKQEERLGVRTALQTLPSCRP